MISDISTFMGKKISTQKGHYIYEAKSNRLFQVTEAMCEIIDYLSCSKDDEIIAKFSKRYSMADIVQTLNVLRPLQLDGYFSPGPLEQRAQAPTVESIEKHLERAADQLILEVTERCNLRCKYCIFSGGYAYSRTHTTRDMPDEIVKDALDWYLPLKEEAEELYISFYGGEPLLNFDAVRLAFDIVMEQEEKRRDDRYVHFSLTTNGTLLTTEMIRWFIDNEFSLTISLDGPKNIHDACRVLPNGKGTYDVVFENIENIYRQSPEYYHNHILISCVLPLSANLIELQSYFDQLPHLFGNKLNFSSVSEGFPAFESAHPPYPERAKDLAKLHKEFIDAHQTGIAATDKFLMSFARQFFEYDYVMFHRRDKVLPKYSINRIGACFPGSRRTFVDVEGDFHICERVNRTFSIGNIEDGYNYEKIEEIFAMFANTMNCDQCKNCWCVLMCNFCFTIGENGTFENFFENDRCGPHQKRMEQILYNYCTVVESNPKGFDYMDEYLIK